MNEYINAIAESYVTVLAVCAVAFVLAAWIARKDRR